MGGVNKLVQKQTEQMMETKEIEFILEGMASSLFRIANSLDELVECQKNKRPENVMDKPFPFQSLSFRTKNPKNWHYNRPETFGQLIAIGRSSIVAGEKTKGIGGTSLAEIDQVFENHGLSFEWMAS